MKFWQRAIKSVTRRKGRSFILFLVIFILGNVIAGSVAIKQSTKNVEEETKRKMGGKATIGMDYEKWEEFLNNNSEKNPEELYSQLKAPTIQDYEKIGQLSYVKYFDYASTAWIGTNKIQSYTPENGGVSYGNGTKYQFNGKGVNRSQLVDIEEGLIKIVEGSTFTDQDVEAGNNVVLISKEVAELNNVKVGDQLVFDVTQEEMLMEKNDDSEEDPKVITFDFPVKVAGIFSVVRKEASQSSNKPQARDSSEIEWMAMEQINSFYAPNKLIQQLNNEIATKIHKSEGEGSQEENYDAQYVLKTVDDVEAFRNEGNALLGDNFFVIRASVDDYDQIAGGMNKLGKISQYVVIIAAVASILIISLVVLLFLRDRKHELGIYLSLGESRSEIVGQIIIELLVTSALALLLSLVTGNLLGGFVSDSLLQTDWLNNNQMGGMIYNMGNMISYEDIQDAYKVTFSAGYIISYLILGLGTVLLSAVLPLLYILRLNPKKIMM